MPKIITKKPARTISSRVSKSTSGPLAVQAGGGEILQSNQYKSLALRSMFWRPDYLQGGSAWVEHLPFAFWIVEALQPSLFVELGTHYGHSYFSFCQAIKRLGLNTPSYAVDTWRGDDQAGHYDESVYQQVESYNQANYPEFSSLLRCTFDEALSRFKDGSIDLLHIDGFHTYEAVRHDFESWLPKLSEKAVVLFHDTNVRRDLFGVHKYYAELTAKYPHFEFIHGHGLGVLGVGKDQSEMMQSLYNCYAHQPSRNIVYELFSRLGRSCHDLMDLNADRQELTRFKEHNHHLEQIAHQRSTEIQHLTAELGRVSEEIQARAAHITHLEAVAGERGAEIERLAAEIAQITAESNARHEHIVNFQQMVAERGVEIERLNGEVSRLTEETVSRATTVAHLEQVAGERGSEIERLNGDITRVQEVSETRHGHIEHLKQMTAEQEAEIERLNGELVRLNEEAGAKTSHVAHLEQVAAERGVEIERLNGEVARLTEETGARATTVAHLEQVSGKRGAEIERMEGEIREKTEVLDRYIQESAQMARMIVEVENEKEEKQSEIVQLNGEIDKVSAESQARANHICLLEEVNKAREEENQKLRQELCEKIEVVDLYIQESAQMARMIIKAQEERDEWRRMSVTAEIEEVIRGTAHETGEHQHINYTLRGITHLGRKFSRLDVRIVEHRGNAGMVIFEPISEERPFYAWEKHGEENGRSYMLIIPSEKKGEEWLVRSTTNDLLLCQSIASFIGIDIMANRCSNAIWHDKCVEILHGIDINPPRLHYDDVQKVSSRKGMHEAKVINPSYKTKLLKYTHLVFQGKKLSYIEEGENAESLDFKKYYLPPYKKKIWDLYKKESSNFLCHLLK
jgi:peptidoglycan hydrolase CwlO-like protein